jgi:hypothetical protein
MISKRSRRRTSRKRSGGGDKKCIETPCSVEMPERTITLPRNKRVFDPPSSITYPSYTIYKQSTKGLGSSSTYWIQRKKSKSLVAETKGKKEFMNNLNLYYTNFYNDILKSSDAELGIFKNLKKV